MSGSNIDSFTAQVEAVREKIESSQLNALRDILPDRIILDACREVGHTFRRRLLGPVVAVFHMIGAALWPEKSFNGAWQWNGGRAPSGSLAKARKRVPLLLFERLFRWVVEIALRLSEPYARWRGHRVVNLDGTCVSMEDNPELHAEFGTCNTKHGPGKYPLARMVAACLAKTMVVMAYSVGAYGDSEQALTEKLLPSLQLGDLIVGDRHFAGANLYAKYISRSLEFLTPAHQRLKIRRLKRVCEYADGDFIAELPVNPQHRREDPSLPETVRVRLIRVTARIRGKRKVIWLVTSLLEGGKYPAAEIAQLYAERWRIETLFLQLKVGLGADVLRSKSPDGVRKELAARMMALNMVRVLMLEAAVERGEDPSRLSFVNAVRLTLAVSLKMSTAPVRMLPELYDDLLAGIASVKVPWRPGRNEPRMKRRETKHYETLRTTRAQWRETHASEA